MNDTPFLEHRSRECFDPWKEAVKEGSVKISETTRKNTIQNFNKHLLPLLGHQQLNKLNVTTLKRYFTKLRKDGSSVKTVYNIYTDLKQVVKYAMKQGIATADRRA